MLPVIGWRLWYSDGSFVASDQMSWEQAPDTDVQVLEIFHDPAPYRTLSYGVDEYQLSPDSTVKFGRWMNREAFEALVERVVSG